MFHINAAGEAGVCRAKHGGCPFGSQDEHYSNADDARSAFESKMSGETLQVHKKLYKPRDNRDLSESTDKGNSPAKTQEEVDFEAADKEYSEVYAAYNDPNVTIPLSTDALYLAMQKRDQIAAKLGFPTLMSKIDADGTEKRAKRDEDLKTLKQLRSSVKSNEVGPGTDRERLYNVEKVFISAHTEQHPIMGSHELRAPAKDVWEVAHSVAKYELENQSAKIEEIKKFSFELSSKKREQRKNLISNGERMVAFYQGRLDEAEKALKDPNPDYPYDRKLSTSAAPSVARFW